MNQAEKALRNAGDKELKILAGQIANLSANNNMSIKHAYKHIMRARNFLLEKVNSQ